MLKSIAGITCSSIITLEMEERVYSICSMYTSGFQRPGPTSAQTSEDDLLKKIKIFLISSCSTSTTVFTFLSPTVLKNLDILQLCEVFYRFLYLEK